MSGKKNKITVDFDRREKRTPVVQRFISQEQEEESPPLVSDSGSGFDSDSLDSSDSVNPAVKAEPEEIRPPKYYLANVMETTVTEEVTAALKHISDICKCNKCFLDICALALNSLPPYYATSEQGKLFRKASALLNIETRNKISSVVFGAIDTVKKKPNH